MIRTNINPNVPSLWVETPTIPELMAVRHEIIGYMTESGNISLTDAVRLAGLLENGGWDRGFSAGTGAR